MFWRSALFRVCNIFSSHKKMKEVQHISSIILMACSCEITLSSPHTGFVIQSRVDLFYYLDYLRLSFRALGHSLWFCVLVLPHKLTITTGELATHTHCSLTRIGSRRSFAFALIGCIIWDTSSRVKPSEEEREETWEACALGWGMV